MGYRGYTCTEGVFLVRASQKKTETSFRCQNLQRRHLNSSELWLQCYTSQKQAAILPTEHRALPRWPTSGTDSTEVGPNTPWVTVWEVSSVSPKMSTYFPEEEDVWRESTVNRAGQRTSWTASYKLCGWTVVPSGTQFVRDQGCSVLEARVNKIRIKWVNN